MVSSLSDVLRCAVEMCICVRCVMCGNSLIFVLVGVLQHPVSTSGPRTRIFRCFARLW